MSETPKWRAALRVPLASPFESTANVESIILADHDVVIQQHRIEISGEAVRLALSNEYGQHPVTLHLHVDDDGVPRSTTVDGETAIFLAAGAVVWTDPLPLAVGRGPLAVALRAVGAREPATYNPSLTQHTTVKRKGPGKSRTDTVSVQLFVAGIDVLTTSEEQLTVAIGDSLTEGFGSTICGYPGVLHADYDHAVLNLGIAGNRLVDDEIGPALIQRIARDAVSAGPDRVVVQVGINDLAALRPGDKLDDRDGIELAGHLLALSENIREEGLEVFVATLPPCDGCLYPQFRRPGLRDARDAANRVITAARFPVVPLHDALSDPQRPGFLAPALDSGDGIHPGDAGARAIADAVNVAIADHEAIRVAT